MAQAIPDPSARRATALAVTVVRDVTVVLAVAFALAGASRIVFPLGFTPVPVTAQTFVVLLVGTLVGARRAGLGGAAYLVLGVAGMPWFATGGATLGYLVGFAVAAWIVGRAAGAGRLAKRGSALAVMAGAHALILLLGATWLAVFLGVGPVAAFTLGIAPFLLGDAVKVAAAAALAPSLVRLRG